MTTKMRSLRNFRNPIGCLILLAAFAAAAGCSTAETTGGSGTNVNHVLPSGGSVSGWMVVPSGGSHASTATQDYIANGGRSSCTECHGSDLGGGISGVSCFGNTTGCHHGPVDDPVGNWKTPAGHGATAKKAPGSSGFASCQICHGKDFSGGGADSCYACHAVSPHAPKPWLGSPYTHTTTDKANAPVCYQCHAYTGTANPNNPHVPPTPAAAGTAPGCYNGTMCHNQAGHPAGWVATTPAPQPHGVAAKKDGTVAGQGFPSCKTCHGDNFAGTTAGPTCLNNANCHGAGVASPHAPRPWLGSPYSHTDTAEAGNAPVCYQCHAYTGTANPNNPHAPPTPAAAGTAPGCYNGTMCHNEAGHAVPFNTTVHYSVTSGTFTANCGGCHAVTGTSPVSGAPLCTTCHVAASPLTAANCTSCHASPPNSGAPAGAAYANIAGAHGAHIALTSAGTPITCNTCHNGLGTNTLNHYNAAKSRVAPGDAAFLATYNAQSGASSFNSAALSCSNVSCHGGQATPNWQTGAINVNTQCTNCHAQGGGQYNSYNSGQHGINSDHSTCTNCHNTTTLAVNHFTSLSTTAMEGPASATIGGAGTSIPAGNYNAGSCTPSCHGTETW